MLSSKHSTNHRWIIGAKLTYLINQYGLIVAWDYAAANVADNAFQRLIAEFQDEMIILADTGFHAKTGDPTNRQLCRRGTRNMRMVIETVLSMLTMVCYLKKVDHRTWTALHARLGFTAALFNILVQWDGFPVDDAGIIRLSITQFSLYWH